MVVELRSYKLTLQKGTFSDTAQVNKWTGLQWSPQYWGDDELWGTPSAWCLHVDRKYHLYASTSN